MRSTFNGLGSAPVIMYHGMPSGLNMADQYRVFRGRHLLVSYATGKEQLPQFAAMASSVLLDNGAFTEWKKGKKVDYDGYCRWVEDAVDRYPNIDGAFIPDVIDGTELENDDMLDSWPRWLKPWGIPVWHLHESPTRLKRLANSYLPPRVALGSSGEFSRPGSPAWWDRIREVWGFIPPECRVHGLRMASPRIVEKLPFYSVDSTTAGRHANLGAKYEGPLKFCKPRTRVQAYAEYLESTPAALTFNATPMDRQKSMWGL